MTTKSKQERDAISSTPADALPRYEHVVALGRKLVEELGEGARVDTLSRWMAHYIAELIDAADNSARGKRTARRRECFETILELWSHRAELPGGRRPFEDVEPIVRALESLDPSSQTPHFFAAVRRGVTKSDEGAQTATILEFVDVVDSVASIIIVHALVDAARCALDKSRDWVAAAEEAGRSPRFISIVASFVSAEGRYDEQAGQVARSRDLLVKRIEQLEKFRWLAVLFLRELRQRLDALPSLRGASGDGGNDESTAGEADVEVDRGDALYGEFQQHLRALLSNGPARPKRIEEALGLVPLQTRRWLERAEQDGDVERTSRSPVTYALTRESLP